MWRRCSRPSMPLAWEELGNSDWERKEKWAAPIPGRPQAFEPVQHDSFTFAARQREAQPITGERPLPRGSFPDLRC